MIHVPREVVVVIVKEQSRGNHHLILDVELVRLVDRKHGRKRPDFDTLSEHPRPHALLGAHFDPEVGVVGHVHVALVEGERERRNHVPPRKQVDRRVDHLEGVRVHRQRVPHIPAERISRQVGDDVAWDHDGHTPRHQRAQLQADAVRRHLRGDHGPAPHGDAVARLLGRTDHREHALLRAGLQVLREGQLRVVEQHQRLGEGEARPDLLGVEVRGRWRGVQQVRRQPVHRDAHRDGLRVPQPALRAHEAV